MPKKTPDYDNVFKTMKSKHKRLFISVINDVFEKNYAMDTKIEILPSEGYLTESETIDGSKDIKEQISDFVIKIENEIYLLECQSYDDGSMAIRIAEYAFIVARQFATWEIGHATIPMPRFSIIYIKRTEKTPKATRITFIFPDGQKVNYESANVILEEFTKEYIVEKRLFPYIPFYIARYERNIVSGNNIEHVAEDLKYFRDEMVRLHKKNELTDDEVVDLMGFVNTIITHITDGNENEERLVNIMGGTVIETESEKLIRRGKAEGKAEEIIEMGQEFGLDEAAILKKLQEKIGVSLETAIAYLERYGKQFM
ncbi:MAG: Rpn family recombination-promoting nuclease/putative transposase [Lachnospiraceae bacterium]|nr:Rpn family recombination-promoting nuclease/putative transposase [Lachnospiraceae bacterium]